MNWKSNRMRRLKKVNRKDKSVALVAKNKEVDRKKKPVGVIVSEAPSRNAGESKLEAGKGKGKD